MSLVQKRLFTLAVLTLFAGAGIYIAVWQNDRSAAEQTRKAQEARVLDIANAETIVRLVLTTPSSTIEITHSEDGWHIDKPLATDAEDTAVDAIVHYLCDLKRQVLIGQGAEQSPENVTAPADLAAFGLQAPRFKVALFGRDDPSGTTLLVGNKSSFDGSIFVKRDDDPHVFTVDGGLMYQVDKNLFDLREKRLAIVDREHVQRITVSTSKDPQGYALRKDGDTYVLTAPRELPTDDAQVDGLISALSNMRAKSFVSEVNDAQQRSQYGLSPAPVRVRLQRQGGEDIALSFSTHGDHHYVTRDAAGPIAELPSDWVLRKIDVDYQDLRDKRLMHFVREDVRTIAITKGENTLLLQQTAAGDDGDVWQIKTPEQHPAQRAAVVSLLYRLGNLKADRVVAEEISAELMSRHGLEEPGMRVELKGAHDESLAVLRLGHSEGIFQYVTAGKRIDLAKKSDLEDIDGDVTHYRQDDALRAEANN